MDSYDKLLDNLCRDIIMRELVAQGVSAIDALRRYQSEPELKESVAPMASIHVKNAISLGRDQASNPEMKYPDAVKLGPGMYRLQSSRRNPVTGRFDR